MPAKRVRLRPRLIGLLRVTAAVILALTLSPASAASDSLLEPAFSEIRFLMDTLVRIQVWGEQETAAKAGSAAFRAIQEVAAFSDAFDPASEVARLNRAAGQHPLPVSPRLFDLLKRTLQISRLSGGALDPTVGPLVSLWGFSRPNPCVPAPEKIAATLRLVGYRDLVLDETRRTAFLRRAGMALDLGATAKGYAVDAAGEVLQAFLKTGAIGAALVDAGGDVLVVGKRPGGGKWRIGVRHPRQPGVIGVISLDAGAVVTSGDYERFFVEQGVRYSHLLDPHSGYPATKFSAVTIVAPNSTLADALSTAVFVLGPEKGAALVRRLRLGAVFISPELTTTKVGRVDYLAAGNVEPARNP